MFHLPILWLHALQVPCAFISFIDEERQWIKSCAGIDIPNPNINRIDSLDAKLMFPATPEINFVLDLEDEEDYRELGTIMGVDLHFRFYMGAALVVDNLRVGVLSVLDTKPHKHVPLEDRQNLLDLSIAVSNMVQERRMRNLQLRKQRANLMLGLNHNLGAPVCFPNAIINYLANFLLIVTF
jgi:GAF domain-containing protein